MRWVIPLMVMVLIAGFLWWRTSAPSSPTTLPLPTVQASPPTRAGEQQPVAPGFKPPPPLPEIKLSAPIPELRKLEFASNGFIEAAHGLLLVPGSQTQVANLLGLAQRVAKGALEARGTLASVDLSLYRAEDYAGFGGPPPLLTASVPKERLADFLKLSPTALDDYNRLWVNPAQPLPPERESSGATDPLDAEPAPTFEGTPQEVKAQQALQLQHQRVGPVQRSGLYYHGPPNFSAVALTFDDAVHPLYAPLLLDALWRGGVKATFFVVGRNAQAYPYFVRDLASAGHEIANHTFHHVRLVGLSDAAIKDELLKANQVIEAITGKPVRFFRPPGGRYNTQVLRIVKELGMTTAFWTDDPGDFNNPGSPTIENRTLKYLRKGGIVLLHDNAQQTLPILVDLANDARAKGFQLTTLSAQAGY